jgi:hypothetical protein
MKNLLQISCLSLLLLLVINSAKGDLNNGLIAHYPFDGNADDASGNGYHGVVHGATLVPNRFGVPDSAYSFDGVNDYINVVPGPNLMGARQFAISAWVKSNGSGKNCAFFIGIGSTNARIVSMLGTPTNCGSFNFAGQFRSYISGGPEVISNDDVDYNDDQWHFFVFTYNGSRVELYIDAQLIATNAFSGEVTSPATAIIGSYFDLNHAFGGIIDDIRIYNRALAEYEIKELFYGCPQEQHATYSFVTNQLTIPFIDLPLLDPNTKQPTGEMAVFRGEFQVTDSPNPNGHSSCENLIGCFSNKIPVDIGQFTFLPSCLQYVVKPSAERYCHAVYSPSDQTLTIPFLSVPSVSWPSLEETLPIEVFEVSLKHEQIIPLHPGVLYLEDYKHLYTLE